MDVILFKCPNTEFMVQYSLPIEERESDFEGIVCPACMRIHFVNRKGKVFGAEDE
jgi:hypothetical protein